jgi:hypothetical protein
MRVTTQAMTHAGHLQADAAAKAAAIRADKNLSDVGRAAKLRELTDTTQRQLRDLRIKEQAELAARHNELERRLFKVFSSDASSLLAQRDATDRAAQIRTDGEAQQLLRRAELSGDTILANAIGRRAVDAGWGTTFNEWAQARPNMAPVIAELSEIDEYNENTIAQSFAFHFSAAAGAQPVETDHAPATNFLTRSA